MRNMATQLAIEISSNLKDLLYIDFAAEAFFQVFFIDLQISKPSSLKHQAPCNEFSSFIVIKSCAWVLFDKCRYQLVGPRSSLCP